MVYITGDTHGDISWFKNPKLKKLGEKDILIVCGDFGYIFNGDKTEKQVIEYLASSEAKEEKLLENQLAFKTPIVRNGKSATVGYQPDVWKNWE